MAGKSHAKSTRPQTRAKNASVITMSPKMSPKQPRYFAHYSHISLGIINMFISALFFAMMNACVKILSPSMSAVESIFFRSIIMVVLLLGWFVLASLLVNEIRSICENFVEAGFDV